MDSGRATLDDKSSGILPASTTETDTAAESDRELLVARRRPVPRKRTSSPPPMDANNILSRIFSRRANQVSIVVVITK